MEGGINEDQNFYSRRLIHSATEYPDPQIHNHNLNLHQHSHHPQPLHPHHYEPPPLPDFESRSTPQPQLPPKLPFLTTANLQAVAANGFSNHGVIDGGDPAEFYREYRGVHQSANGYTDNANGMAAMASESRPGPSSLRSNGNGTTPKHPSIPGRTGKAGYRSASSPLDDRAGLSSARSSPALNGLPRGQQPSVKDLLKRFDSNNEQSSSVVRKPPGRIAPRQKTPESRGYQREQPGYMARTANHSLQHTASSASRAGLSTRENGTGRRSPEKLRATQRTRFATEDQHSNNTLSSATRVSRPRHSVSGPQPSKSMTNLSPTSPTANPPSLPQTPARRPLFGEVLPIGPQPDHIGYGIPHSATRRTSDSGLHPSWGGHQRSRSAVDTSPSSPTAWYLEVKPKSDDVDPQKFPRSSPGHNRNHSDFADTKVNTMNGVSPQFQPPPVKTPPSHGSSNSSKPAISRIPVSSKRLSNSSESSSPISRASSPFTTKTFSNGKTRKTPSRPYSAASRVTPPGSRAMTPTQKTPRAGGRGRKLEQATNSSLNAYISAAPSKASPPLRSSRPRQPVSSASPEKQQHGTARPASQQARSGMKLTRNGGSEDPKPRKVPGTGPVDYAARRATIQRAYTKSIYESEQKEICAANMRRLSERQARNSMVQANKEESTAETRPETPPISYTNDMRSDAELSPPPLQITTSFTNPPAIPASTAFMEDSPTLGMPGTFVDEEPASAISCATGITEIDNEPQTEEARLNRMISVRTNGHTRQTSNLSNLSAQMTFGEDHLSPEQAMYGFNQEHQGSIDIMLATTPVDDPSRSSTVGENEPQAVSNGEATGENHGQHVLSSSFYTESPNQESPPDISRPSTAFGSHEEMNREKSNGFPVSYDRSNHSAITSYQDGQQFNFEPDYAVSPDTPNDRQLQLPNLRTALDPPSVAVSEAENDYLNTPVTDMDDEGSVGLSASRRQSTYDPYDANPDAPMQVDRRSRQSQWTDYSVNSRGDSRPRDSSTAGSERRSTLAREYSRPPSPTPPVPPKPAGYSPLPSPNPSAYSPRIPSPSHQRLPPLSTGDGFLTSFAEDHRLSATSGPLWPDYSPPLPPVPRDSIDQAPVAPTRTPPLPLTQDNKRPPSSYQSSHDPNQIPESRRGSDDVYSSRPSVSTPRSSTQISFEDAVAAAQLASRQAVEPQTAEEKEAAEVLRKRLFKRKMGITELIDTESMYLKDMNVVTEIYQGTAEACPKLDSSDIKTIFRNSHEIVTFTTTLLDDMKAGAAAVYSPRTTKRSRESRSTTATGISGQAGSAGDRFSTAGTLNEEHLTDEQKDQKTFIGASFGRHLKRMQNVYTDFLKNGDAANARLETLQTDPSVKVWLSECDIVAKDLTNAWNIDALMVKPFQRITRYELIFKGIIDSTDANHPDYLALQTTYHELRALTSNIDSMKDRISTVHKAVAGRKRKESDVRSGLAKAFGRTKERATEKIPNGRIPDDANYLKLDRKYVHEYLQLQVVLRDVEDYNAKAKVWVEDQLKLYSAMELHMRVTASSFPEIESKWVRFNMSMRDMGTVVVGEHTNNVQEQVIKPFETLIHLYGPPGLAIKQRAKRRIDFEKLSGVAKPNDKDAEKIKQYNHLNQTLKEELPLLFKKSETISMIALSRFIMIQSEWFDIWQKKVKMVLEESQIPKDINDIVDAFKRDYKYQEARPQELGIINGNFNGLEKVGSAAKSDTDSRKPRPSNLSSRSRGLSINSERTPSLPTPDFAKRLSGQFVMSPIHPPSVNVPSLSYSTPYATPQPTMHSRQGSGSPATPDYMIQPRPSAASLARPNTGRSFASDSGMPRGGSDYNTPARRESGSTHNSAYHADGPPTSNRPYSGIFRSAMPLPDGPEDSMRSSRASSRDRNVPGGYKVLYLAASLFEFQISATKSEAGYPYLTYSAGEIFDVIGEKGELWLAKNQDDPSDRVGWIWSKHFARLATD
ncbi:DBL homology (DH-domain) [Glarea lozoyensis ATCC 20868]|uniref:DBL homology (DH-domain) n=1 Tax=Glarea lozoyensis (strain ATCC 20868 / MF5171) TaxID=1116229 RepID=S3CR87_GLAL2|nr:DBL homology (DH-domain) [Glarea lozoyensis ATCC 20868]EPE28185.1 DBL homology (DH-domain) [Glarea lozoyensis ATCC 20868]